MLGIESEGRRTPRRKGRTSHSRQGRESQEGLGQMSRAPSRESGRRIPCHRKGMGGNDGSQVKITIRKGEKEGEVGTQGSGGYETLAASGTSQLKSSLKNATQPSSRKKIKIRGKLGQLEDIVSLSIS